jgi:hypothetical protein
VANKNTIAVELTVNDNGTVTIRKFGAEAEGSLQKVEKAAGGLGVGFDKTWAGITAGAAGAIYVFEKIVSYIKAPIEAFMTAETSALKLGMALKNQGDYSREGLEGLQEYAAQLQQLTAYEDDQATAVMGNLKSYGMLNDEVKRATLTAMDFASAKANEGMTITSASELIGKAYAGETAMLSRYGIIIDDNIPKGEKFAAVMAQLNARFGGSAQAELSTYAGQWKQIKNQLGDVQELIGFGLLKGIQGLTVGAGLLATTFLTAGNAILGILRMLVSPVMLLIDGLALLAEKAGMPGVAEGMREVTSAIGNAQGSIVAAREEVLGWTSKNYDLMTSTEGVTGALDKMNISGQRTQQVAADNAKILLALSSVMAKLGEDQLKFSSADYSEILKKENASLGEIKAGLESYLGTLKAVYDARIKGQDAIEAAMMKAKPEEQMKTQLETLKTEKAYLTERLGGWQLYYNTLLAYHGKAADLMKQKTEELKKIEEDLAGVRKTGVETMLSLQIKLMEAQGKAANDEEIYLLKNKAAEEQWALAMSQTGEARVKSIQQYIQMVGQLTGEVVRYGETWINAQGNIAGGNQTIMTSQDAIRVAMERTQFAQQALITTVEGMAAAKQKEMAAIQQADNANDAAMADARVKIGEYQQQVLILAGIIEKMDRDIAIGVQDNTAGPIAQIRAALDSLYPNGKVINVTINQRTVSSGEGVEQNGATSTPGPGTGGGNSWVLPDDNWFLGNNNNQPSSFVWNRETLFPNRGGGAAPEPVTTPYPQLYNSYPEAVEFPAGSSGPYSNYSLPGTGSYMPMGLGGYTMPDWESYSGIPQYAIGTKYVPKTGLAVVHQGEEIRTAAEVRRSSDRPIELHIAPGAIVIQGANKSTDQLARELVPALVRPLTEEMRRQNSWAA